MGKKLNRKEVLTLIYLSEGKSNKDISLLLNNSVRTIEGRRKDIIHKLGALNSLNMIHIAHKRGLIK